MTQQLAETCSRNPTSGTRLRRASNWNTKINDEGGGDAEEYRVKAVKDRNDRGHHLVA
jgi:hypothetical protein